jgi:DNA-binding SARP family transcriptional activator
MASAASWVCVRLYVRLQLAIGRCADEPLVLSPRQRHVRHLHRALAVGNGGPSRGARQHGGLSVEALRFRLLGSFEVSRGDEAVAVSSNKLRVVLATLLLAPNRTVSVETLFTRLWGGAPPESGKTALQVHVMRLRRALGEDQLIETTAGGYRIVVDTSQIDVSSFRSLLAQAGKATGPMEEAGLLADALALWRGPALLGIESTHLHQAEVPLLTDERLSAVARRAEIALAVGRHAEVIGELTRLVDEYPLQERPWLHLINTLHRSGRRADALDAYRRMYRLFRDELGIGPGSDVQMLHQQVLAEETGSVRSTATVAVRPGQLPPDLGRLVGRRHELSQLCGSLSSGSVQTRLVVVTGAPGTGKTALAVHAAHRIRDSFPDGQLYVDLQGHSLDEPLPTTVVIQRFLRALGVFASEIPDEPVEQVDLYRSVLAERRVLVVLDNAASAQQVRPLLPGGSRCSSLVTSRNVMHGLVVAGGEVLALGPLSDGESREMLVDMVGLGRVAAEPHASAALARSCGHLPLALRIAGANLAANPYRSISEYAKELRGGGGLRKLAVEDGEEIAIQAAFDLSYARLPAPAARLFGRLGLLPGADFTASAAAVLISSDCDDATRLLEHLVAANLVQRADASRFQMHDLLRKYAAGRASEDPESEAAIATFLDYSLFTARNAVALLYPGPHGPQPLSVADVWPAQPATEEAASDWLVAELPNLFTAASRAQDHGRPFYARHLLEILRDHLWSLGLRVEGLAAWNASLRAAQRDDRPEPASTGSTSIDLDHYLVEAYQHAVEQLRAEPDRRQLLETPPRPRADGDTESHQTELLQLVHHGHSAFVSGRPGLALDSHHRALELAVATGEMRATCQIYNGLGMAAWATGDLQDSIEYYEQSVRIAETIGDDELRAFSSIWLAVARTESGDCRRGAFDAQAGIDIGRTIGSRQHEVIGMVVRAYAWHRSDERRAALDSLRKAHAMAPEIEFGHAEVPLLFHLAESERVAGELISALAHADRSLAVARELGVRIMEPMALVEIARCRLALDRLHQARSSAQQALEIAAAGGQRLVEASALHTLGDLHMALGERAEARRRWLEAQQLCATIGAPGASCGSSFCGDPSIDLGARADE